MKNFWEWMRKKGYSKTGWGLIGRTKQMLIGYMIEYLYCARKNPDGVHYGTINITIDIFEGKADINEICKWLVKEIVRIK